MRLLLLLLCAAALVAADSEYAPFDARAMLGIQMTPPDQKVQLANGTDPNTGVQNRHTYPGTAAARMGLVPEDLIIGVNGSPIGSMNDLRNEVALIGVGGDVQVEVLRQGQRMVLRDRLGEWPPEVPYEPIDQAAERRFRDWQARRLDRTQQAVSDLRRQVEDLERSLAERPAAPGGDVSREQAMTLPAGTALAALAPFRFTWRAACDSADRGAVSADRRVAWDARVLIGTAPVTIY